MVFDRIILSTNEDKRFLQFVKLVTLAWKKFFPEVKTTVAFITDKNEEDSLVKKMKSYADNLHLFRPIEGVPSGNLAKVCRHIMAGYYGNEICVIHDMDSLPLQKEFHYNLLSQKKPDHLMAVGAEVYENTEHKGKFPSGHMSGEGYIFKELFNPKNMTYEDLIASFVNFKIFDHKEAINAPLNVFSDESLIRAVISLNNNVKIQYVKRNVDIHRDWVDRSWWGINREKLFRGGYTECNLLRPFDSNFDQISPIVEYICGKKMTKEEIIFS